MRCKMAANTNPATFLEKSNCNKISRLNGFALEFGLKDNFDVPCQILASSGFQLIV